MRSDFDKKGAFFYCEKALELKNSFEGLDKIYR